jgi:AraC family transcriptional regulator
LGKIAVDLERALLDRRLRAGAGQASGRLLASGDGWSVHDVICTSDPSDRPFEERHSRVSLAIVAAGTFQYRSTTGRALMTPGSILLGNAGHCFECGHEHGSGDRCIAFNYSPECFEAIAADAGASGAGLRFTAPRLPPLRESAGVVAQAGARLIGATDVPWEEIAVRLAARVARLASYKVRVSAVAPPGAVARVTRVVRSIEGAPSGNHTLGNLAEWAGLSRYHFLRTFQRLTGLTPHQYVRRARLRAAALRLAGEKTKVIDVAYDSGFGDVSNFNRAFRDEFGATPLAFRARAGAAVTA